jgi:DNA polymerase-3 subunit epsilon
MKFAAVDVETANENLGSICQIGVATFENGRLVSEWKTYVDPEDDFDSLNIQIHGIDSETVAGAPTFGDVAAEIRGLFESAGVVASHTHFDRTAIARACEYYEVPGPTCTWLDTARVARRTWTEISHAGYGLRPVCDLLGYEFVHHDALEDAKAAGMVLLAAMKKTGLDIDGWLKRVRQPIDRANAKIELDGNPDGPLWGQTVVFTGTLSVPRRDAAAMASQAGCNVSPSVTKATTLLVVGDQDVARLHGQEKSGKHRKAEELIAKGQLIRVVRESDFRRLLELEG